MVLSRTKVVFTGASLTLFNENSQNLLQLQLTTVFILPIFPHLLTRGDEKLAI